jgi:hypothetical protein
MTKQEYYDLLVKTSLEGGFPARESWHTGCKYRTTDGKKCAVGLLIPDEKYSYDVERQGTVIGLSAVYPDLVNSILPENMIWEHLREIQKVHDYHIDKCSKDQNDVPYTYWEHDTFVKNLNELECFSNVQQVKV